MGRFIAIEGGDGSGKATQAQELYSYATKTLGIDTLKLSFPRYGQASAHYAERYLNGAYGDAASVHPEIGSLPYAIDRFAAKSQIEAHLEKQNSLVIVELYGLKPCPLRGKDSQRRRKV